MDPGKGSVEGMERMLDPSIKPCVFAARAQGDEILLMLDVGLLCVVDGLVVHDEVANAAILGCGRLVESCKCLRASEDCCYVRSASTLVR